MEGRNGERNLERNRRHTVEQGLRKRERHTHRARDPETEKLRDSGRGVGWDPAQWPSLGGSQLTSLLIFVWKLVDMGLWLK